jgi:hypothetical protein
MKWPALRTRCYSNLYSTGVSFAVSPASVTSSFWKWIASSPARKSGKLSTELQPADLVEVLAASGQHDDGRIGGFADCSQHLETVHAWHGHLEQHNVGHHLKDEIKSRVSVRGGDNLRVFPLQLERYFESLAQAWVIVDNQDLHVGISL